MGDCIWTTSEREQIVDDTHLFHDSDGRDKNWEELKVASVIAPASSWAKIKGFIDKECQIHKDCDMPALARTAHRLMIAMASRKP